MLFKTGDLVVCLVHEGLGRIVSAKRAFGLCRVRWSPHCVSEHPRGELLKTGSIVTTKDGVTGRIIALSACEVKIIQANYETAWVHVCDILPGRTAEKPAGNTENSHGESAVFTPVGRMAGAKLPDSREVRACDHPRAGQMANHGKGATR